MTKLGKPYTVALAIVGIAVIVAASYSSWNAAHTKEREHARQRAVEAMAAIKLPAGITRAPQGIACGVSEVEGICLASTLTAEESARALAPIIEASSKPAKGPDLGKAPANYTIGGQVAGERVLVVTYANLVQQTKKFQGSTVSVSLAN